MNLRSFAFAAIAAFFATAANAQSIETHEAYAYTANGASGGVFMVIHNHGNEADRLIGVRSDAAERVELHESMMHDGMMMMMAVEGGLEVPADGELLLERGGYHVMFMGIREPWEQDGIVTLTLIFEHAGEIVVEVPVDLTGATGMSGMDMSNEAAPAN